MRFGAGGGSTERTCKKIHSKENLTQQKAGELQTENFPRRGKRMEIKATKGQSGQELK